MRILVVEDNFLIALSVGRTLEEWGHEAVLAHSPEEALARASESIPDLVLMDIDLDASRDGVETLLAIHEAIGFVRHVYLTGFSQKEIRRNAERTRPYAFLEKPVWPDDLRELIDELA